MEWLAQYCASQQLGSATSHAIKQAMLVRERDQVHINKQELLAAKLQFPACNCHAAANLLDCSRLDIQGFTVTCRCTIYTPMKRVMCNERKTISSTACTVNKKLSCRRDTARRCILFRTRSYMLKATVHCCVVIGLFKGRLVTDSDFR